jgi:hypothetical protein
LKRKEQFFLNDNVDQAEAKREGVERDREKKKN